MNYGVCFVRDVWNGKVTDWLKNVLFSSWQWLSENDNAPAAPGTVAGPGRGS